MQPWTTRTRVEVPSISAGVQLARTRVSPYATLKNGYLIQGLPYM
jgi:hypothetical protein